MYIYIYVYVFDTCVCMYNPDWYLDWQTYKLMCTFIDLNFLQSKWQGFRVLPCQIIWNLLNSGENLFESYGNSRENLLNFWQSQLLVQSPPTVICMYLCIYVCICLFIYIRFGLVSRLVVGTFIYIHIYIYIHTYIYIYVYMNIYICVCVCVYMCVHVCKIRTGIGVATNSRLLKIIGLFCRISSLL